MSKRKNQNKRVAMLLVLALAGSIIPMNASNAETLEGYEETNSPDTSITQEELETTTPAVTTSEELTPDTTIEIPTDTTSSEAAYTEATATSETKEEPVSENQDVVEAQTVSDPFTIDANGVLTSYSGSATAITLPDTVTSIGTGAFSNNTTIVTVVIPARVTSIGQGAFQNCSNLTTVTMSSSSTTPATLASIGVLAFDRCSKLNNINLPDSITTIGNGAFQNCSSLTSLTLPAHLTSLNMFMFNCSGLASITIPDSVTSIGMYAFAGCTNLSSITLLDNITTIAGDAFLNSTSLNIACYENTQAHTYATAYSIPTTKLERVAAVAFDKTSLTLLKGATAQITPTITPSNAYNKTLTWISSDTSIVSVDQNGNLVAQNTGTATITATATSSKPTVVTSCEVTVTAPTPAPPTPPVTPPVPETPVTPSVPTVYYAESVQLSQSTLYLEKGKSQSLQASVLPTNTTNPSVTWTSSDSNVATVDATGTVTAVGNGNAVITVKTSDGSEKSATCNVTVGYSITYNLNGGTNSLDNPATFTGSSKITLKNPTKAGYTFAGWYTDKAFTKSTKAIKKGTSKNVTIYAKWSKVSVDKPTITTLSNSKTQKISLKYDKVTGATGYEVTYATDKKFTENSTTITVTKTSTTITGLEKGKKYYVKVRAYKLDSVGNKVYGKYSSVKNVTIKK